MENNQNNLVPYNARELVKKCNDVESNLKGCTINQDFYGGGSLGKVIGKATSVLDGCTVHGNVFGGGYSATLPTIQVRDAGFTTDPNYNSSSGMFEPGVFSGTTEFTWKNASEAGKTLTNGQSGSDLTNHYLYTDADLTTLGQVANTDLTVTNNCLIEGGVYGGGDMSSVNENTLVKIENAGGQNAIPNVYGGGNTADVEGNTEVRMTSGTVSHDIYGGGRGETTIVGGNVIVNMGAKTGEAPSITYSGTGVVQGDVYGGSALGKVNTSADKTTTVNVYGGTVNGSVFGGGLGQLEVAADPGNSIAAKPAIVAENQGNTTINVEGGLVKTAVYGGSNVNGVLKKDATVTLIGGTVGDSENSNNNVVFGGGKGAPTLMNGNVTVNVGTKSDAEPPVYAGTATIYGHVYGGGALGNTNEAWVTDTSTNPATTTLQPVANTQTLVNLYAGTINGYAYGGALGDSGTPAIVGGDVTVTLDGAKVHQVFGANNVNGTPKGHVKVWVKKTNNFTDNEYKNTTTTPRASRTTYDVEAVYGGGNQADYIPADALLDPAVEGNSTKIAAATAEVLIEGCQKTSINYVYGGGNAAAVPATDVTVKGSYIINKLYGGGNGSGDGNPGANVGIYKVGDTPTNYGTGKAVTKLLAGYINEVYGGSNTKGDVRGGTDVRTKGKTEVISGDCCNELNAGQVYGAGSQADVKGDVNIILECMPDDFVDAVYGGAKNATINGNVSLTVTSGKFGRVFGGNNEGGSINGSITVNAYEDGCQPLIIGELYGGGNQAPYSIWGCNDDDKDGKWTPNTPGGTPHVKQDTIAVSVNVYSCTSVGKVFGGGYGKTADVVGNTHVYINMMKGIVNGNTQENIGRIGQVFGGGNQGAIKGNTLIDIGTALANEVNGVNIISGTDYLDPSDGSLDETITAGIYGGGNEANVEGNTTLNIGTAKLPLGVNIAGDIFGGGYGQSTHVTGDVTVNIGADIGEAPAHHYVGFAQITGDVYGGSAKGKVNATKGGTNESPTYSATTGKTTHVNFYGGVIKDTDTPSGKGNIYGGGLGDLASLGEGHANVAADVYGPVTVTVEKGDTTTTIVNNVFGCNNFYGAPQDTVAVMINGGTINHSVYGGGNQAEYTAPVGHKDYPAVRVVNGTITEDVFGGGLGLTATVAGNPHVTIGDNNPNHKVAIKWSVYGGGSLATVDGSTYIVVNSDTIGTKDMGGAKYGNIYGGGFGSSDNVRIGLVKGNTNITVNGGNILHNIYGGGAYGSVGTYNYDGNAITGLATESTGKATIRITGGTIGTDGHENGMIFGASRGDIAAPGAIQDHMAWVYDTEVIIGTEGDGENVSTPSIRGSVYGSGENGHTFHNANVTIYSGMVGITTTMPTDPAGQEGSKYPYRGNVYGGGCGTDKYYSTGTEKHDGKGDSYNATAGIVKGDATVTISGGHVVRNVYGAGAMGSVTGGTTVNISGKAIIGANGNGGGYVYAAARGETGMGDGLATVGSTTLNISGGTIWGSAFGGGQLGTVKGSVAVNVSGGVVKNDVYGGGALANTNTDNWTLGALTPTYINITDVLTIDTSPVVGLYTKSGDVYTEITDPDAKAATSTIYYEKRMLPGTWADGKSSTSNTTSVILTGGVMGNVYGGGLGDDTTPVYAFGDVKVIINKPADIATLGGHGAAFTQNTEDVTVGGTVYTGVPLTGRIFGCNNIKGTPLGNVLVEVYSTRQLNASGEIIAGHKNYEIQAVYGGGNQADYAPAKGKETEVNIYGCSESSIARVYGGGNSAWVPSTNVTIWGSFDIEYAFAGGNGGQPIKTSSGWVANEGAGVNGHARITCHGGKIGEIFGGSDFRGIVRKATTTQAQQGSCPLRITKLYGAGKEADVEGDVNVVISGCTAENSGIEYVCGGSYKANISGNVHLTITAGYFQNVYGGNDQRGSIGGNIIVDIEETDPCKPIIINNLVGGGNQANFPGKKDDVELPEINPRRTITVNVKSATYIGNVYGGSFKAETKANTFVNVNMIHGNHAGQTRVLPADFGMENAKIPENIKSVTTSYVAVLPTPSVGTSVVGYYTKSGDDYIPASISDGTSTYYDKQVTGTIDNAIGIIGNVFGGGKQGQVIGNAQVNIGSLTEVPIMKRINGTIVDTSDASIYDGEGKQKPGVTIAYVNQSVLGAHITGDVFGGGEEAEVTGNAEVFICANKTGATTYAAVEEGTEKVTIGGSVYGGGSEADVLQNARVTMADGYVFDGVYGGGLKGSVGTFTRDKTVTTESNGFDHSTHSADCLGKPTACADGTGTCTVVVSGGQVGPIEVATKGMKNDGGDGPVDVGFVFGAGRGDVENPNDVKDADFHTFVNKTDVTISGGLIMASVYGGGENGRVLHDTHVKIQGGQIGCGEAPGNVPRVYTEEEWASASVNTASTFKECLSWDYKSPFLPYDPFGANGGSTTGTDGHTYYGSVFGGGSGYFPYEVKSIQGTVTGHEWLRSAGAVYGDTYVDITGGHILTSVYGGNETTDVGVYTKNAKGHPVVHQSGGKCTINMVGGTIGVPRTDEDAKKHPVTCYLYGAGKGDQRTLFNTWTNVQETVVNVSGTARIFGSVFGGGEDGHILGDAKVNIGGTVKIDLNGDGDTTDEGETFTAQSGLMIGTTGTSYVDGNVFGGGRGFSGEALTAGSTGGNAEVNIFNGTMLGSIYGGGRLASVGIDFTPPTDPLYGQLVDDTNEKTHGHIAINISGGTIGTTTETGNAHPVGGNVFGGSMGRITLLDGTLNPIWPKQAVTKDTEITISGGTIFNSVYGGSEYGIVRDKATVTVSDGTIHGSVYGGGYGSDDNTPTYITAGDYAPGADYVFTPMIWTGCVSGDTEVNIAGGTVKKNVYGGGEVASVGLINCHVVEDANGDITIGTKKYRYTNLTKHADIQGSGANEKVYGFALSWPYKFEFISGDPRHPENIGGKATVNVTGGHIGSDTWNDGSGYVFGGSKGQVAFKKKVGDELVNITDIHEQRYVEGLCANVRETEVNVKYSTTPSDKTPSNIGTEANCIMGAVYGGGEDGHVYENAAVNITNGLIGLSVYGAGKGISTYQGYLRDESTKEYKNTKDDLYSWTAGKIYGNTTVTMTGGHVLNNVYGGGYLGSVGKGNYSGGADDYFPAGYGETLKGNLWTSASEGDDAWEFLHSGKATVKIEGGTVGTQNGTYGSVGGDDSMATPTGMVFGGSRGQAAEDIMLDPRYEYAPNFYLGYVNETKVTIGTESNGGPRLYGQVFGGGRDGHVRNSTHVIVNDGTIGQTYAETAAAGGKDAEYHRYHRGNVYGAGSGLGLWSTGKHGMSSGSVTNKTTVDINGGTNDYATASLSKCTVNINGGTIGDPAVYDTYKYGGTIYGGSRGDRGGDLGTGETIENYATVLWTEVNINPHPTDRTKDAVIAGNVYGGARGGQVKKDTKVNLLGGVVKHNAYGGGRGTTDIAANVLGNTTVELNNNNNGGEADGSKKGCSVDKVFGCNDLNGTPKGHVLVHVYGTQNSGTADMSTKVGPGSRTSLDQGESEGYIAYLTRLINLAKDGDNPKPGITADVITTAQTTIDDKVEASLTDDEKTAISNEAKNVIAELQKLHGYDVTAVYGGGDLAPYVPTVAEDNTEVIIEGCGVSSIKQVYGGGNAAYAPATNVLVKSAYVIDELFGGGNGLDNYVKDGKWYENPGANVGYKQLADYDISGSHGTGADEANKYTAITYTDATTPEGRKANYSIGTGIASTTVNGGHIHNVYGGSNKKGNIRAEALLQIQQVGTCPLITDKTYSGSKEATIDAETNTIRW